jgi:hypothetical protein
MSGVKLRKRRMTGYPELIKMHLMIKRIPKKLQEDEDV